MLNYRELDWKLIGAALALTLIGVVLILSAQYHATDKYEQTYFLRQLLWLVVALVVFAAILHTLPRAFDVAAYIFYGSAILLLILVFPFGSTRMGATRWFSLGPISVAPADIAKVALILVLSRFFAYTKWSPASPKRLAVTFLLAAVPAGLILKQPDLGSSLVFWAVLLAMWFWSGLSLVYMLLMLSPLFSLLIALQPIGSVVKEYHWQVWVLYAAVLFVFVVFTRTGFFTKIGVITANLVGLVVSELLWNRLADYQQARVLTFLNPANDPRGAGYQVIQSKIAVGSGGLWGKGFLAGSQTRLDFLPERHTDFIFSVLAEEFGLIGCLVVLTLFGFLIYRSIMVAAKCRSRFVSNVAFGAVSVLLFQLLVNVGMTLGIMPVTGLALPFLSYGGSSLVLSWTLVGLIALAQHHWQEY